AHRFERPAGSAAAPDAHRGRDSSESSAGDRLRDAEVLHQPRLRTGPRRRSHAHSRVRRSPRLRARGDLAGGRHAATLADGGGVEPSHRAMDLRRRWRRRHPRPVRRSHDPTGARDGAQADPAAAVARYTWSNVPRSCPSMFRPSMRIRRVGPSRRGEWMSPSLYSFAMPGVSGYARTWRTLPGLPSLAGSTTCQSLMMVSPTAWP